MKRVTGIGGVFFRSKNPEAIAKWYEEHLGISIGEDNSFSFEWKEVDDPQETGYTVWAPFKHDTKYFDPSNSEFMVNYRVDNLEELIRQLGKEGVTIVGEIEAYEYGKFGWIMDPDGRKIELWEPVKGYRFE